ASRRRGNRGGRAARRWGAVPATFGVEHEGVAAVADGEGGRGARPQLTGYRPRRGSGGDVDRGHILAVDDDRVRAVDHGGGKTGEVRLVADPGRDLPPGSQRRRR